MADGEENHWIVSIAATELHCVLCRAPATCPPVFPRPVLSVLPLRLPGLPGDVATAAGAPAEGDVMLTELALAQLAAAEGLGEGAPPGVDASSLQRRQDGALTRLFHAAAKSDRLVRALELASRYCVRSSLEGAMALANKMRLPALAEKLGEYVMGWELYHAAGPAAAAPPDPTVTPMQPLSQPRQAQPSKPSGGESHLPLPAGAGDGAGKNVRFQAAGSDEKRSGSGAGAAKPSPLVTPPPPSAAPKRKPSEAAVNPFARKPKV